MYYNETNMIFRKRKPNDQVVDGVQKKSSRKKIILIAVVSVFIVVVGVGSYRLLTKDDTQTQQQVEDILTDPAAVKALGEEIKADPSKLDARRIDTTTPETLEESMAKVGVQPKENQQ